MGVAATLPELSEWTLPQYLTFPLFMFYRSNEDNEKRCYRLEEEGHTTKPL